MNDKAFILGNGPNRSTDKTWLNNLKGDTYGCNAMYRDFEPDFLVANDWAMMVEIINSTYTGNCQFTGFEELPMEALEGIKYMPEYNSAVHIGEQEKASTFVFRGSPELFDITKAGGISNYHIIWLDESLRHIVWGLKPQFENMSTGLCAIQLALETGYDEIDVIGFSGLKDRNYKNIYDGTENYKFDPAAVNKVRVPETYEPLDASHWESVYIKLVKQYPNTKINLI
jgi:hypothetical protein